MIMANYFINTAESILQIGQTGHKTQPTWKGTSYTTRWDKPRTNLGQT